MAGVLTVVLVLGLAAALVTHWFPHAMKELGVAGGLILLVVGLDRMNIIHVGWFSPRVGSRPQRGGRYIGSYVTGIGLAMGFQVTLLLTLTLIAGNPHLGRSLILLIAYALGFGLAFLVVGLGGQSIVQRLKHLKEGNLIRVNQVAGALTMAVAVLLIVNDGDVLKALATWKTGPVLAKFLR